MLEIEPKANITVVGQANNGCEAVELFAQLQPNIGLIDLQMPQMDDVAPIAAIRKKFSTVRLIVLKTYVRDNERTQSEKVFYCPPDRVKNLHRNNEPTGSNHSSEARDRHSAVGDTTRLQVIETLK